MTGALRDQQSLRIINEHDHIEWPCAKTGGSKFGFNSEKMRAIIWVEGDVRSIKSLNYIDTN